MNPTGRDYRYFYVIAYKKGTNFLLLPKLLPATLIIVIETVKHTIMVVMMLPMRKRVQRKTHAMANMMFLVNSLTTTFKVTPLL